MPPLPIGLYIRRRRLPQNPCNSTWFPSSRNIQSLQSNMADQAFHLRSISLPFRSFPATIRVEEEFHKVRTCAASSTTDGLRGLGEVYDGIDELLRQPGNQQSLSHPNQRKWVEEELDLSLRLLDLNSAIRDGLAATTAHLQDIQLSIRRKDCSNTKIKAFHHDSTRLRSTKKNIANSLRSLKKQMESSRKIASCSGVEAMLVEAREILISLFRSASSFLSGARTKPKGGGWWSAFVARELHNKKVACGVYEVESEGESLGALLWLTWMNLSKTHIKCTQCYTGKDLSLAFTEDGNNQRFHLCNVYNRPHHPTAYCSSNYQRQMQQIGGGASVEAKPDGEGGHEAGEEKN